MKKLISALALILCCPSCVWAGAPTTLTTLRAIRALSNSQAARGFPVAFEATVTSFQTGMVFVQDGDMAIFVGAPKDARLDPGDRVLVKGATAASFRPVVESSSITLLRHGARVQPVPVTFSQLIGAQRDCMLVKLHAVVHSADLALDLGMRSADLQLLTDGGIVHAYVGTNGADAPSYLLDAEVEVTGVEAGVFDDKMELIGVSLLVASLDDIKVLKRSSASPWSLPFTPMDQVLTAYSVHNFSQRVKVHGTITYDQPGSTVVIQNGAISLWITTAFGQPLRIGEQTDVTGFPDLRNGFLTLTQAEIKDTGVLAPITPLHVTWRQLAATGNTAFGHHHDLVSLEGKVVMETQESAKDIYFLVADGHPFTAIYHRPVVNGEHPGDMKQIRLGSIVNVTGICAIDDANPFNGPVDFSILLRSFDDIAVVARPSLLTIRNLTLLVGLLLAVVIAVGARAWYIERKLRRHTSAMAYIERRRSLILEDINGSRPLAEIVENITELVSVELQGAPCWCQIADGAQLGIYPPKLDRLRIVSHDVPARSGAPLGAVFAAIDPLLTKLSENAPEALAGAAGLIALAIETRRLYSDLLHRSEFDMLTDIHNRFSLDKHLKTEIEVARLNAGIFGLIYIDLDCFKQINDQYR